MMQAIATSIATKKLREDVCTSSGRTFDSKNSSPSAVGLASSAPKTPSAADNDSNSPTSGPTRGRSIVTMARYL